MGWVGIVFWVITNIPALIKTIKALIDLIHSVHPDQAQQMKAELTAAVGDKTRFQEVVERWRHRLHPEAEEKPQVDPVVAKVPDLV